MIRPMSELTQNTRKGVQVIEIKEDQDNQRIDNFLVRVLSDIPKTRIYRLIRKGEIRVNKGRIKINHRLKVGDFVRIPPVWVDDETAEVKIPLGLMKEIEQCILFENDQCIVINKPSGLAVHGGSGLRFGLVDVVKAMRPAQDYMELAHRLDRETSGCIILAKNRKTLTFLHEQFKTGQVIKKYLAGVVGHWNEGSKTVTAALKKNVIQGGERMVEVAADGKTAVSHFTLLQHYPGLSLMEVTLDTGRTHQIRVHAAHEGHPVAGDKKYGDRRYNQTIKEKGLSHLFLHAHWLELFLPDRVEKLLVTAPLPPDLQQVLTNLESAGSK
jgi:23S rRNA pseudouridine955/2504/2580 synthase